MCKKYNCVITDVCAYGHIGLCLTFCQIKRKRIRTACTRLAGTRNRDWLGHVVANLPWSHCALGILIRNDDVFYWKTDARTEIPVSLCARDATTRFISDKWIRQQLAMRSESKPGMRLDPRSTTGRSLARRVSSYTRSRKNE